MTKAEEAAMEELHTTPEKLAERQEHISQLLNGSIHEQLKASVAIESKKLDNLIPSAWGGLAGGTKPPRKKRSDAGKPKQKAPAIAQQPGFLSAEQASRLTDLINSQETRRAEYDAAQDHVEFLAGRLDAARQELCDYLLELQGKKTG